MKSNLERNNNKYYILQLLKSKSADRCALHIRYGRVGEKGAQIMRPWDLAACISEYNKLFKAKTGNSNPYMALEMKLGADCSDTKTAASSQDSTNADTAPSKLDKSLQSLMEFIHDKNLMENSVVSAGYDANKLPLGKLSDETVKEGYKYLR